MKNTGECEGGLYLSLENAKLLHYDKIVLVLFKKFIKRPYSDLSC